MPNELNLSNRLSARAIAAGVVSVFALMILFMLLAAALGFWNFDVTEIDSLGTGFWLWSFAAWIVSNYLGAYTASIASRSTESSNGMLQGFVIWASVSVIGMVFIGIVSGSIFSGVLLPAPSEFVLWGAFACDFIALGSAFRGGVSGSIREMRAQASEERIPNRESQRTEPAFGH
jgi:hypothetical protein